MKYVDTCPGGLWVAKLDNGLEALDGESGVMLRASRPLQLLFIDASQKPPRLFAEPFIALAICTPHGEQEISVERRSTEAMQGDAPFVIPAGASLSFIVPKETLQAAQSAGSLVFAGLSLEVVP
jgi:hypothetical protein